MPPLLAQGLAGPEPNPSGEPGVVSVRRRPVGRGLELLRLLASLAWSPSFLFLLPPSTHHLTLRAFSPTVAAMGDGGPAFTSLPAGDLSPGSHPRGLCP